MQSAFAGLWLRAMLTVFFVREFNLSRSVGVWQYMDC